MFILYISWPYSLAILLFKPSFAILLFQPSLAIESLDAVWSPSTNTFYEPAGLGSTIVVPSIIPLLLKMFLWRGRVLCNCDKVAFASIIFDKVMLASRIGETKENQLNKNHQKLHRCPFGQLATGYKWPCDVFKVFRSSTNN